MKFIEIESESHVLGVLDVLVGVRNLTPLEKLEVFSGVLRGGVGKQKWEWSEKVLIKGFEGLKTVWNGADNEARIKILGSVELCNAFERVDGMWSTWGEPLKERVRENALLIADGMVSAGFTLGTNTPIWLQGCVVEAITGRAMAGEDISQHRQLLEEVMSRGNGASLKAVAICLRFGVEVDLEKYASKLIGAVNDFDAQGLALGVFSPRFKSVGESFSAELNALSTLGFVGLDGTNQLGEKYRPKARSVVAILREVGKLKIKSGGALRDIWMAREALRGKNTQELRADFMGGVTEEEWKGAVVDAFNLGNDIYKTRFLEEFAKGRYRQLAERIGNKWGNDEAAANGEMVTMRLAITLADKMDKLWLGHQRFGERPLISLVRKTMDSEFGREKMMQLMDIMNGEHLKLGRELISEGARVAMKTIRDEKIMEELILEYGQVSADKRAAGFVEGIAFYSSSLRADLAVRLVDMVTRVRNEGDCVSEEMGWAVAALGKRVGWIKESFSREGGWVGNDSLSYTDWRPRWDFLKNMRLGFLRKFEGGVTIPNPILTEAVECLAYRFGPEGEITTTEREIWEWVRGKVKFADRSTIFREVIALARDLGLGANDEEVPVIRWEEMGEESRLYLRSLAGAWEVLGDKRGRRRIRVDNGFKLKFIRECVKAEMVAMLVQGQVGVGEAIEAVRAATIEVEVGDIELAEMIDRMASAVRLPEGGGVRVWLDTAYGLLVNNSSRNTDQALRTKFLAKLVEAVSSGIPEAEIGEMARWFDEKHANRFDDEAVGFLDAVFVGLAQRENLAPENLRQITGIVMKVVAGESVFAVRARDYLREQSEIGSRLHRAYLKAKGKSFEEA